MRAENDLERRKEWSVVAPFFRGNGEDRWIDDFVLSHDWQFRKVPLTSDIDDWHLRSKRGTGVSKWLQYWNQSQRVLPASGIITVFPQAASVVAIQKTLRRLDIPLLAWCFNIGLYPNGPRRLAARLALKSVDRFVVHSTGEVGTVSEFLDIPPHKIQFVPLQRAPISIDQEEDTRSPFVASIGSANRDYRTFFAAAEISGLPCKVVAAPRSVDGLQIPSHVSLETGLTAPQCHQLVQRSRFSVVPLLDPNIAAGQVTVVESMRMNRPIIATHSMGTLDYIRNGESGILVPPQDPEALAAAMLRLWEDPELRKQYAREAAKFAEESLSDTAAARALAQIITELEQQR